MSKIQSSSQINVGGDIYDLDKTQSIFFAFDDRYAFEKTFKPLSTNAIPLSRIEELFRKYLPSDRKPNDPFVFDANSPNDKADLLAILKRRRDQLQDSNIQTLRNVNLTRILKNINEIITSIQSPSTSSLSKKKKRKPLTQTEIFELILEFSWYLMHPNMDMVDEWESMIKKLDTKTLNQLVIEIQEEEEKQGGPKKSSPLNYFKNIDLQDVLRQPSKEEALKRVKQMVLFPTLQTSKEMKQRLNKLLNLLYMKKYIEKPSYQMNLPVVKDTNLNAMRNTLPSKMIISQQGGDPSEEQKMSSENQAASASQSAENEQLQSNGSVSNEMNKNVKNKIKEEEQPRSNAAVEEQNSNQKNNTAPVKEQKSNQKNNASPIEEQNSNENKPKNNAAPIEEQNSNQKNNTAPVKEQNSNQKNNATEEKKPNNNGPAIGEEKLNEKEEKEEKPKEKNATSKKDELTSALEIAFRPLSDYFRTMYDPLYTFFEKQLLEFKHKHKDALLNSLLQLLHFCNHLPSDKRGVYRIDSLPPVTLAFIEHLLDQIGKQVTPLPNTPISEDQIDFIGNLKKLPKMTLSTFKVGYAVTKSYKNPANTLAELPYLHFMILGKNMNFLEEHLFPRNSEEFSTQMKELKSFFKENTLYVSASDSYLSEEATSPLRVFSLSYDEIDRTTPVLPINEMKDNYFNLYLKDNKTPPLFLEKLVKLMPDQTVNSSVIGMCIHLLLQYHFSQ